MEGVPRFMALSVRVRASYFPFFCEGLPGVYSTIWCLCYKTNELKKKKQKEKHWACLHRLKKKGVAFVAAEHGSVEPSRSTRHDVTCSNRRPGLRLRARALCLGGCS